MIRFRFSLMFLANLAIVLLTQTAICRAQPLVTGDLSLYYSFDSIDEDGFWMDGSGNGLNALTVLGEDDAMEDGLDDIRLDTNDMVRGGGSAWFDTNQPEGLPIVDEDSYRRLR